MAYPQNPYFTPKYTNSGMTWGDLQDAPVLSGYDITPFDGDFNAWAQQYTDPTYQRQFAYTEEDPFSSLGGGGQQLNALPGLWRLANSGYFNQFGQLTPEQQEWLGSNIAREQHIASGNNVVGGLGIDDLQMLSVLAGPLVGSYYSSAPAATSTEAALSAGTGFTGGAAGATATGAGSATGAAAAGGAAAGAGVGAYSGLGGVEQGASQAPIESNFEPSRFGSYNPRTGAPVSNIGAPSGGAGQWSAMDLAQAGQAGLGLLGGIQSMASAEDMEDALHAQMQAAQANERPAYPYEMNWDKVNEYLRDPMSVLRNNPGYLASVDFLDKEGRRQMAAQGYNVSGNKNHYLADVMGKNASKWYEQAWAPIRDAAGLMNPPDPSRLAQVGVNAQGAINSARQNATQNMFAAGSMALPSIFKFALG